MSYQVPSPGEVWAFRPILPKLMFVTIDEFDRDAYLVRFTYHQSGRQIELALGRFVQHYVLSDEDPNTSPDEVAAVPLGGDLTPSDPAHALEV